MPHFADRLIREIKKKSPICVGLDPRLEQIPGHITAKVLKKQGSTFTAAAECLLEFNKGIIDAVYDLVPAVKPQIAFFEQYGFSGIWAFRETCRYAQSKGLLVIADVKRNDIGSTAEAYAEGYLGKVDLFGRKEKSFDVDAVTVSPYLGYDGIKPFVECCKKKGKGIFVLVKTSNRSASDLQDQVLAEKCGKGFKGKGRMRIYELMAHYLECWGADEIGKSGYSSIGAVVGATYPREAERLRELMPRVIFLVPGYGAQGGTAAQVKACFNKDGLGAIVNSSRGIIFAYEKSRKFSEKEYGEAAREAVLEMKRDLEKVLD